MELMGRRFQDLLGMVNQRVAAKADRVYTVMAGIPVQIKGPQSQGSIEN
jgi:adenosylcobinamide kinase/adenosylcobinamide-phosphate guanylyltransferase